MFADSKTDTGTNATGTVKVWLEGGIIRQEFIGDQTGETVTEQTRQTDVIVAQLQAKQQPVLVLSDFTKIGSHTQAAREAMRKDLSTRYFDRAAAFGLSSALRIVGELLLKITGKKERVRIFEAGDQAEAWLREFNSGS